MEDGGRRMEDGGWRGARPLRHGRLPKRPGRTGKQFAKSVKCMECMQKRPENAAWSVVSGQWAVVAGVSSLKSSTHPAPAFHASAASQTAFGRLETYPTKTKMRAFSKIGQRLRKILGVFPK